MSLRAEADEDRSADGRSAPSSFDGMTSSGALTGRRARSISQRRGAVNSAQRLRSSPRGRALPAALDAAGYA